MTYFAIGESDGGAGERRLGPFDTPEEAEAAGKRETKDSNGAFVFKGVVDEANNQAIVDVGPVSTNSVVRNAIAANRRMAINWGPWNPGQRVKEENGTRSGTVVKQGGLNDLLVTVKWDDGKTEDMHRFQLKAANRRVARNAGNRDAYESAINQARMECEKAIRNEPDADDYSDVTTLVKQAKSILDKAYRAI